MSQIEDVIRRVAAGKAIDAEREAALMSLQFARQGEVYADEIIELLRSLDETNVDTKDT